MTEGSERAPTTVGSLDRANAEVRAAGHLCVVAATLFAGGLLLWATSVPAHYFLMDLGAMAMLSLIGLHWLIDGLVGLVLALCSRRRPPSRARLARQVALPLVVTVCAGLLHLNAPQRVRFALDRPALQAYAEQVMRSTSPSLSSDSDVEIVASDVSVGSLTVKEVHRVSSGVQLLIAGTGSFLSQGGYVYSPGGLSTQVIGEYEQLGDGWYSLVTTTD